MSKKTQKQLEETFELYCNRCLRLAVKEYLHRSDHSELRELKTRIELLLEAQCKSEICQEECNQQGSTS